MYCVALTGNISSGKSTALAFFAAQGIYTISADQIARELTESNPSVIEAIRLYFGDTVFSSDNTLNRRALRSIIFSDPKKRIWLEQLLHPCIRAEILQRIQHAQSAYSVIEIPLLLDKISYPYLNRILLITAEISIQIKRIMARDHCTKEEAMAILKTQPTEQERTQLADDIIINNQGLAELTKALQVSHEKYLQFAMENQKKQ